MKPQPCSLRKYIYCFSVTHLHPCTTTPLYEATGKKGHIPVPVGQNADKAKIYFRENLSPLVCLGTMPVQEIMSSTYLSSLAHTLLTTICWLFTLKIQWAKVSHPIILLYCLKASNHKIRMNMWVFPLKFTLPTQQVANFVEKPNEISSTHQLVSLFNITAMSWNEPKEMQLSKWVLMHKDSSNTWNKRETDTSLLYILSESSLLNTACLLRALEMVIFFITNTALNRTEISKSVVTENLPFAVSRPFSMFDEMYYSTLF